MGTLNFNIFQLHPDIMKNVRGPGFTEPTPFQTDVIPPIMQGKDVIGLSAAGTARTATFLLPILHRLAKGDKATTRALILSPAADTAERTHVMTERLAKNTDIKSIAIYGKSATESQRKILRSGCTVIIGCPGSIINCLWKGMINLSSLEMFVIDDADGMAAEGVLPDIFNILMCLTKKRQTLLFTKTLPANLKNLSHQLLNKPVTIQDVPGRVMKPAANNTPQTPPPAAAPPKMNTALLRGILSKTKNDAILVFARTKDNARRAAELITKAGYQVAFAKGRLPQKGTATAPKGIPTGPVIIIIVTDNASRGLDTARIFRVINDPKPSKASGRDGHIGRTGRLDSEGKAYTLVTKADELILFVLEKYLDAPLEQVEI